jgi:hypothetical protein
LLTPDHASVKSHWHKVARKPDVLTKGGLQQLSLTLTLQWQVLPASCCSVRQRLVLQCLEGQKRGRDELDPVDAPASKVRAQEDRGRRRTARGARSFVLVDDLENLFPDDEQQERQMLEQVLRDSIDIEAEQDTVDSVLLRQLKAEKDSSQSLFDPVAMGGCVCEVAGFQEFANPDLAKIAAAYAKHIALKPSLMCWLCGATVYMKRQLHWTNVQPNVDSPAAAAFGAYIDNGTVRIFEREHNGQQQAKVCQHCKTLLAANHGDASQCNVFLDFGEIPAEVMALPPFVRRWLAVLRLRAGPFRKDKVPVGYLHFRGSTSAQKYDFSGTLSVFLTRETEVNINRTALALAVQWMMRNNRLYQDDYSLAETLHAFFQQSHRDGDGTPIGTPFVQLHPDAVQLQPVSQTPSKVGTALDGLLMCNFDVPPESRHPQNSLDLLVAGERSSRQQQAPPSSDQNTGASGLFPWVALLWRLLCCAQQREWLAGQTGTTSRMCFTVTRTWRPNCLPICSRGPAVITHCSPTATIGSTS